MHEIFIKYNPYKVETEISVNGVLVKDSSNLNYGAHRLQEWVDVLPKHLVKECRDSSFSITFQGTNLDYEDLESSITIANKSGIVVEDGQPPVSVQISCTHIPAKEVKDKEQQIEELFRDIQAGPYEEFRQKDMVQAFTLAQTSEFPINIIATMSAGKSTLINSLLGQALMPVASEPCTATITEIKDYDESAFYAEAFDVNGNQVESHACLTLDDMKSMNNNPDISHIVIRGNIPFVSAEDVRLVLVDTPGPNNARNIEHQRATMRALSDSSKTLVLYVMNAGSLGINDEDVLLSAVAQSMAVSGRQSRDRFMFVVNKLDTFKTNEDNVVSSIQRVKEYLESKGIKDPNIFPASALTALSIRTLLKDVDLSTVVADELDDATYDAYGAVRKMNNSTEKHLEKYAPLTSSARGEVNSVLFSAKESGDKKTEALVHSGIIPIEAAIRTYVEKYAKTAKIKGIYDTFASKIQSQQSFERTKKEIFENEEKRAKVQAEIESIKAKLADGKSAQEFKAKIDAISYDTVVKKELQALRVEYQTECEKSIADVTVTSKISVEEAESKAKALKKKMDTIIAKAHVAIEERVFSNLEQVSLSLLTQYKDRIKSLEDEYDGASEIKIDPLSLLQGDIDALLDYQKIFDDATSVEQEHIKVGSHREYHELFGFRRWLNDAIGTNFNVDYDVVDDFDDVDVTKVNMQKFSSKYSARIEKELMNYCSAAEEYVRKEVPIIIEQFKQEFDKLDVLLEKKVAELNTSQCSEKEIADMLKVSQNNLKWLEAIQKRIESVLEI